MVLYDLSHLTQDPSENVVGPIQDTEALLLYALVRGMRMRRILELGGLNGYSALNFLKALAVPDGKVYTVDVNPVRAQAENHVVIQKDVSRVMSSDVDHEAVDLVFFDCHMFDGQLALYRNLSTSGVITDDTILALHDTNLHPCNVHGPGSHAYEVVPGGWVHAPAERMLVNEFADMGYHAFSMHTRLEAHDASMPFRHGLTLMQRFHRLAA